MSIETRMAIGQSTSMAHGSETRERRYGADVIMDW